MFSVGDLVKVKDKPVTWFAKNHIGEIFVVTEVNKNHEQYLYELARQDNSKCAWYTDKDLDLVRAFSWKAEEKKYYILYSAWDDSAADIYGVFDSMDKLKEQVWYNAIKYAQKENADAFLNDWNVIECNLNKFITEDDRYENKYLSDITLFPKEKVDELIQIISKH